MTYADLERRIREITEGTDVSAEHISKKALTGDVCFYITKPDWSALIRHYAVKREPLCIDRFGVPMEYDYSIIETLSLKEYNHTDNILLTLI
jgi:hypothetical protein